MQEFPWQYPYTPHLVEGDGDLVLRPHPGLKLSMYARMIWHAYDTAYLAVRAALDKEHPEWSEERWLYEVARMLQSGIQQRVQPPYSLDQGRRIGEKLAQEWQPSETG